MTDEQKSPEQSREHTLAHRADSIGWALFLVMIGCLWLVPEGQVPEGTWLIGTGVIMLGVNIFKYLNGIKMNPFTIGVGVIAIGLGIAGILNVEFNFFAVLIVIIGANIILKMITDWWKQRQ